MVEERVRRVLVYRLGSLGDMAVAVPALRLVARAFPNAARRLLTNEPVHAKAPAARAVLEGSGLVSGCLSYPVGTRSVWALGWLWLQLRWWRPEVVVYLAAARGVAVARRDVRFFRACGVRRVVGAPVTEALQGNFFGEEPGNAAAEAMLEAGEMEMEAARLARCLSSLGSAELERAESWSLGLTAAERASAAAAVGGVADGFVAVCVGTKVQAKDWGREKWRELLGRVGPMVAGRGLVLLGAAEEAEVSGWVAERWPGAVVNLCGRVTPRESAAVLERARVFLGHDSGPMHLAASVGTPVVAVFSARNVPRVWFPAEAAVRARGFGGNEVVYRRVSCWGCGLEVCVVEGKRCLEGIGVEEVLAAVVRGLGSRK